METEFKLDESRLEVLKNLVLQYGAHDKPEEGLCVMEAVAFFAKEPHSDRPKCASRVITTFAMKLNDRWDEKRRQQLKPFIPRIVGTAAPDLEKKRAFACADWALRELLPILLDAAKMPEWSEKLRALPEVTDRKTADAGRDLAHEARAEVRKKYPAAADAYAAAYAYAAYAAAAADAAYAYAAYAAAAAAYAYAYAAAAAVRAKADASALTLLDRLIKISPGPLEGMAP